MAGIIGLYMAKWRMRAYHGYWVQLCLICMQSVFENGHNYATAMLPPTISGRHRPFGNSRTGGSWRARFIARWAAVFPPRVRILFPMQDVK